MPPNAPTPITVPSGEGDANSKSPLSPPKSSSQSKSYSELPPSTTTADQGAPASSSNEPTPSSIWGRSMTLGRGFINRLSIYPIPQFSIGGVPGGHERWQDGIGSKGFLPDSEDDGDDDGEGNGDDKEEEDVGELLWEAQMDLIGHSHAAAIKKLKRAAELGSSDACLSLGNIFARGIKSPDPHQPSSPTSPLNSPSHHRYAANNYFYVQQQHLDVAVDSSLAACWYVKGLEMERAKEIKAGRRGVEVEVEVEVEAGNEGVTEPKEEVRPIDDAEVSSDGTVEDVKSRGEEDVRFSPRLISSPFSSERTRAVRGSMNLGIRRRGDNQDGEDAVDDDSDDDEEDDEESQFASLEKVSDLTIGLTTLYRLGRLRPGTLPPRNSVFKGKGKSKAQVEEEDEEDDVDVWTRGAIMANKLLKHPLVIAPEGEEDGSPTISGSATMATPDNPPATPPSRSRMSSSMKPPSPTSARNENASCSDTPSTPTQRPPHRKQVSFSENMPTRSNINHHARNRPTTPAEKYSRNIRAHLYYLLALYYFPSDGGIASTNLEAETFHLPSETASTSSLSSLSLSISSSPSGEKARMFWEKAAQIGRKGGTGIKEGDEIIEKAVRRLEILQAAAANASCGRIGEEDAGAVEKSSVAFPSLDSDHERRKKKREEEREKKREERRAQRKKEREAKRTRSQSVSSSGDGKSTAETSSLSLRSSQDGDGEDGHAKTRDDSRDGSTMTELDTQMVPPSSSSNSIGFPSFSIDRFKPLLDRPLVRRALGSLPFRTRSSASVSSLPADFFISPQESVSHPVSGAQTPIMFDDNVSIDTEAIHEGLSRHRRTMSTYSNRRGGLDILGKRWTEKGRMSTVPSTDNVQVQLTLEKSRKQKEKASARLALEGILDRDAKAFVEREASRMMWGEPDEQVETEVEGEEVDEVETQVEQPVEVPSRGAEEAEIKSDTKDKEKPVARRQKVRPPISTFQAPPSADDRTVPASPPSTPTLIKTPPTPPSTLKTAPKAIASRRPSTQTNWLSSGSPIRTSSSPARQNQNLLLSTSPGLPKLDPVLAQLEASSRVNVSGQCSVCLRKGINFPKCPRCGIMFCTRKCRVGVDGGGDGEKHVCGKKLNVGDERELKPWDASNMGGLVKGAVPSPRIGPNNPSVEIPPMKALMV